MSAYAAWNLDEKSSKRTDCKNLFGAISFYKSAIVLACGKWRICKLNKCNLCKTMT